MYTIFVDTGEWAWLKEADDETMYVGSLITSGDHWYGDHHITEELLALIKAWLHRFPSESNEEEIAAFDWNNFNKQGLIIAQRLKTELSDRADVRYLKADIDPSYNPEEGYEILNNGTILPIRRLRWCPV